MTHTAIVTYARGWPALTAVRSLGARGVRVVCGDSVPFAPSGFSRHCARSFRYPDPSEDPEGFLAALEAVVAEERARAPEGGEVVLLPIHSETYLIAAQRERFEALGARLALPESAAIERARDKGSLVALAREAGAPTPDTRVYERAADVYRDAPDLSYPVFVKVRGAAAGVGIEKVDGPVELIAAFERMVTGYDLEGASLPIVQAGVPGDDYCVSALFDRGECVAIHTYRNVRQFPRTTGAGVLRETVAAPEAEAIACRLLRHLDWHGLAQLDFRWAAPADGQPAAPQLIEVNPRFFGGLPQAVAAGVDYPWLVFQLALGRRPEPPTIDPTVRTETPVLGLLATLGTIGHDEEAQVALARLREACAAREDGEAVWARVARLLGELGRVANPRNLLASLRRVFAAHRGTINDVFRTDDPLPVLGVLYPLSVALKHGSLSTAVVLSEARAKPERRARLGLKGHLAPSWRTLAVTALAFLASVAVTQAAVGHGTWLEALFMAPARACAAFVPSWEGTGVGYAAFHVLNFTFLYLLAAVGLGVRERALEARLARGSLSVES